MIARASDDLSLGERVKKAAGDDDSRSFPFLSSDFDVGGEKRKRDRGGLTSNIRIGYHCPKVRHMILLVRKVGRFKGNALEYCGTCRLLF